MAPTGGFDHNNMLKSDNHVSGGERRTSEAEKLVRQEMVKDAKENAAREKA